MKFICNFLLVLNYIVYIIADVCAWAENIKYGLLFLLPLFVFPIVVKLANKVAVSQADKFFKSEWDVFLKKLKWGNSVVFAIVALGYCCLLYTSPSPRDGLLSRMPSSA